MGKSAIFNIYLKTKAMLVGITLIIMIGIIVGLIFNNAIVGFFTVCGLVLLWGIWGMIQGWRDYHRRGENDNL